MLLRHSNSIQSPIPFNFAKLSKTRTFVAVAASAQIRRGAAELIDQLASAGQDVKWVTADNLHWTLQFLGEVDDTLIPAICERVKTAAAGCPAFQLEARGAGAFPHTGRPRTIWLGAGQGQSAMIDLQAAVESQLRKLGFRGEKRRFTPHITLGRVRRVTPQEQQLISALEKCGDYDAGSMMVDEVTVYASILGREGASYQVLARCSLQSP
jgi:2'-5' RNA ligase